MEREPLSEEYLARCLADANRFMAQWTGTSGTLAAHVRRLLWEVERLKVAAAQQAEAAGYWHHPHD